MPDKFNQSYEQTRTYIQRPGCRVHVLVWVCVAWRCVPLANTRYSSHGHKSSWPKPILHTFISNKYRHMGHKSARKRNEHGALAMANANNTRRAHISSFRVSVCAMRASTSNKPVDGKENEIQYCGEWGILYAITHKRMRDRIHFLFIHEKQI